MTDDTFPYEDNPGATHWVGCWQSRGHHNCAVVRVQGLEGRLRIAEANLSKSVQKRLAPPKCLHERQSENFCHDCGSWTAVRVEPKLGKGLK